MKKTLRNDNILELSDGRKLGNAESDQLVGNMPKYIVKKLAGNHE